MLTEVTRVRAVVTDVDGTILRPDGTVSAATLAAARSLSAAGVPLILATARTPAGVRNVGPLLASVRVAVCCNGAIGLDPSSGQFLWQHRLEPGLLADLAAFLAAEIPAARLGVYDGQRWTVSEGYLEIREWRPAGACVVTSVRHACTVSASAVGICHPSLTAADLMAAVAARGLADGRAHLSYGSDDTLDLSPAGVDKGSGVRRALELPGISVDPRDAVGFGDSVNDLPLVGALGRFVAMGNSHPAVLAAADEVTGSVAADGVAGWLAGAGVAAANA